MQPGGRSTFLWTIAALLFAHILFSLCPGWALHEIFLLTKMYNLFCTPTRCAFLLIATAALITSWALFIYTLRTFVADCKILDGRILPNCTVKYTVEVTEVYLLEKSRINNESTGRLAQPLHNDEHDAYDDSFNTTVMVDNAASSSTPCTQRFANVWELACYATSWGADVRFGTRLLTSYGWRVAGFVLIIVNNFVFWAHLGSFCFCHKWTADGNSSTTASEH